MKIFFLITTIQAAILLIEKFASWYFIFSSMVIEDGGFTNEGFGF